MANQDRSRQHSSFSPTSSAQQGGGQTNREDTRQRSEGRALSSRQGTWLGARERDYGSSPFALMQRLTADMDRLFENFGMGMFSRGAWPFAGLHQGAGFSPTMAATWSPHIEMFEQEGKLVVQAELPGLRKDDVQAQIEDDAIVISGERHSEGQRDEAGRYVSERSYGSFYRVIPLPDGADAEAANATFRDGILRIEMPLNQRPRGRRLEIGDATGTSGEQRTTGSRQAGGQPQQQQQGSSET
jgi:HSP20 family protein